MHNYYNGNKCLSQIKNCGLKQGFGTNGCCKQCKVNKPSEDDLKKKTMDLKKQKSRILLSVFQEAMCAFQYCL